MPRETSREILPPNQGSGGALSHERRGLCYCWCSVGPEMQICRCAACVWQCSAGAQMSRCHRSHVVADFPFTTTRHAPFYFKNSTVLFAIGFELAFTVILFITLPSYQELAVGTNMMLILLTFLIWTLSVPSDFEALKSWVSSAPPRSQPRVSTRSPFTTPICSRKLICSPLHRYPRVACSKFQPISTLSV